MHLPRWEPLFLLVGVAAVSLGCAGNPMDNPLTDKEKDTLDPSLRQIVSGDTSMVREAQIGTTEAGAPIFPVFIRVRDPDAFAESDIPVNSWSGSTATARLTVEQIRRAARQETVQNVSLSGRARPHN